LLVTFRLSRFLARPTKFSRVLSPASVRSTFTSLRLSTSSSHCRLSKKHASSVCYRLWPIS
jgi:hypothetical protein